MAFFSSLASASQAQETMRCQTCDSHIKLDADHEHLAILGPVPRTVRPRAAAAIPSGRAVRSWGTRLRRSRLQGLDVYAYICL